LGEELVRTEKREKTKSFIKTKRNKDQYRKWFLDDGDGVGRSRAEDKPGISERAGPRKGGLVVYLESEDRRPANRSGNKKKERDTLGQAR